MTEITEEEDIQRDICPDSIGLMTHSPENHTVRNCKTFWRIRFLCTLRRQILYRTVRNNQLRFKFVYSMNYLSFVVLSYL